MSEAHSVPAAESLAVHRVGLSHPVLSAHVRVAEATLPKSPALLARLRDVLEEKYGIDHATLQVECVACGQGCIECLGARL
jgi:Co/Zn/Cd efflux system component